MNCTPNCLAMVVRDCGDPDVRRMLGRTFRVTTVAYTDPDVGPLWNLEEPQEFEGETFDKCGDLVLMKIDEPDADDLPQEVLTLDLETV